ncbi:MAG: Hsp20/alpha crystallin family protein [Acidimicrobiia bacterium]|nr:Hsp20/alpha crystallin family protein [Acidimicrobiia bacterium]
MYSDIYSLNRKEKPMPARINPLFEFPSAASNTLPSEVYLADDNFVVTVDMPGMDPELIDVEVSKNTLAISAERDTAAARPEEARVFFVERPSGNFRRRFVIGNDLDISETTSAYENGVLTLTIPVAASSRPRKIPVTSGPNGSPA